MRSLRVFIIGAALAITATASVRAADITVFRGDAAEVVSVSSAGPTVLRGGGTMRVKPPKEVAPTRVAYAGKTLWLVAKNESLVACYLTGTGYVGRRIIRCTKARY